MIRLFLEEKKVFKHFILNKKVFKQVTCHALILLVRVWKCINPGRDKYEDLFKTQIGFRDLAPTCLDPPLI